MLSSKVKQEYYQALLSKNTEYDGIFYVGVKTTGVFCRPTCPARKPKLENCEFFKTAKEALIASYRPCQRCRPLSHPHQVSDVIQQLINAVEEHPEKRWKDRDFKALAIDVSTARRQFKKRFGMTFVEYARARRIGLAMKQLKGGESVINTQISVGYESSSGFRDAFSRIIGSIPSQAEAGQVLKAAWLDTPLGPMVAIANDKALYLLEFADRRGLEREVDRLKQRTKAAIIPGKTEIHHSIENELGQYFNGLSWRFKTPLYLLGSDFQKKVWNSLQKIPPGETRSYADLAKTIGQSTAFRAVARANGNNQLAIIIPCHRVINSNGQLGGYSGGIARKSWLLDHESKKFFT